ncbi:MAG: hypothetical protein QW076_01805 [Candidatus Anstonellales archaeon]
MKNQDNTKRLVEENRNIDDMKIDILNIKQNIRKIESELENRGKACNYCSFINGPEYNKMANAINGIIQYFKDNNLSKIIANYSMIAGELERLKYDIQSLMNDLVKTKSDISRFEYFENDFRDTKKYFSERLIEINKKVKNIEEVIVILDSNIAFLKKTTVILQGIRKNRSELEKLIGKLNEKREKLKEEINIDEKR